MSQLSKVLQKIVTTWQRSDPGSTIEKTNQGILGFPIYNNFLSLQKFETVWNPMGPFWDPTGPGYLGPRWPGRIFVFTTNFHFHIAEILKASKRDKYV